MNTVSDLDSLLIECFYIIWMACTSWSVSADHRVPRWMSPSLLYPVLPCHTSSLYPTLHYKSTLFYPTNLPCPTPLLVYSILLTYNNLPTLPSLLSLPYPTNLVCPTLPTPDPTADNVKSPHTLYTCLIVGSLSLSFYLYLYFSLSWPSHTNPTIVLHNAIKTSLSHLMQPHPPIKIDCRRI